MYCILESFASQEGLPVDLCRDKGSSEVHLRIAGGTVCGPIGRQVSAFDYLRSIGREDLIIKYDLDPWVRRNYGVVRCFA